MQLHPAKLRTVAATTASRAARWQYNGLQLFPPVFLQTLNTGDSYYEIYLMGNDTNDVRNLTNNNKVTDYARGWSRGGRYILCYSNRSGNEDISGMNNDGTEPCKGR